LSRRFDNTLSPRNQAELSGKTVREVKTTATHTYIKVAYGTRSFPPSAMRFLRCDYRLNELTRLGIVQEFLHQNKKTRLFRLADPSLGATIAPIKK
jgi:hypothetical protein